MAVRGILRGLTGGKSSEAEVEAGPGEADVVAPGDAGRRLQILDDFEHAGIGWIWATDAQGRLIYLSENASERLGKPTSELMAQPLVGLFETDPDNPDERSGRPLNFQLNARSKIHDLTVRVLLDKARSAERHTWWSISGHPKFDAAGQFEGYRGSAKDVTVEYERKLLD